MNERDEERLAELLSGFIGSCEFAPPFHVVCIGANGAVNVSVCTKSSSATELCHSGGPMLPPLTVVCISAEGSGCSTRIEIEAAKDQDHCR
jgi:hypothetical protein